MWAVGTDFMNAKSLPILVVFTTSLLMINKLKLLKHLSVLLDLDNLF